MLGWRCDVECNNCGSFELTDITSKGSEFEEYICRSCNLVQTGCRIVIGSDIEIYTEYELMELKENEV